MAVVGNMNTLYTPPDTEAANKEWGANCGPCALAAVLGVPVADVRGAVSKGFRGAGTIWLDGIEYHHRTDARAFPGYMGQADLRGAVQRMGARVGKTWRPVPALGMLGVNPALIMVNWLGPWTGTRGEPHYRHIIGVRCGMFGLESAWLHLRGRERIFAGWTEKQGKEWRYGLHWIYDVNVGWCPEWYWYERVAPWLKPKRATGWRLAWGCEVLLPSTRTP